MENFIFIFSRIAEYNRINRIKKKRETIFEQIYLKYPEIVIEIQHLIAYTDNFNQIRLITILSNHLTILFN